MTTETTTTETSYKYPFQNPDLPMEERISNLLSLMTREEKIIGLDTNPTIPRLGVKGTKHMEGLHGVAIGKPGNWGMGFPVPTTQFPQAYGLGETWDAEVIRQAAAAEGYEERYLIQSPKYQRGGLVMRAPNADLARDPRWGRTEESYGEDPFLAGSLVVAFSKGLQGDDPRYLQAASLLKHFCANSNEDTRESSTSNFDQRQFHEYYLMPFRMGIVEGKAQAFMAAYNKVNEIPCTVHPMLKEVTICQWGHDGIICTDAGSLHLLVTAHKYYANIEMAAAQCIKAGIGQFLDRFPEAVRGAWEKGLVEEKDVDFVLRGVFRVMIRLGMLDPAERVPYSTIGQEEIDPWDTEKHRSLARLVMQKSVVLLKNTQGFLPLNKTKEQKIAVIGKFADQVALDWYSGTPPYTVSALEGIRNKVGDAATVVSCDGTDIPVAVEMAKSSDIVILCVGNHPTGNAPWLKCPQPTDGKEAVDRKSIALEQQELAEKVYQANPKTVVVLVTNFPTAIPWIQHHVPAIVHIAHNCQELGNGLADVLFGDYNPAGRLTQTWPRSENQLPPMLDYDIRNGRTYMYFKGDPLYAFGYGLSYTTFDYGNLRTSADRIPADGTIAVSVDVTNTGNRAGDEVVQLYVKHPGSAVERPKKALKGFRRVTIAPKETVTVEIPLPASRLAYWNEDRGRFDIEKGRVTIQIGRASNDIPLETTVEVG
jgi:beta-glucosidase